MASLTESIQQAALAQGFDVVGIASLDSASPSSPSPLNSSQSLLHSLWNWLEAGYHGTMLWMAKNPERRADPRHVLPGCQSIICVGMNYWTHFTPKEEPGFGRIARYAWGQDYHRVFQPRLKRVEQEISRLAPEAKTLSYVDTGPIMEKIWAQQAGLGWIGKHANLVSPNFGSWLLLGEILTTLRLEASEPGTDLCGSCTLCIQACPTQAITENYMVDATKCISYLTIEYRGEKETIPPTLRKQMGNRIFGCDDCLDVCPYNMNAVPTNETAFFPTHVTQQPNLRVLSKLNESSFAQTFRDSPLRRSKYAGFQRNLHIALENEGSPTASQNSSD